MICPHCKKDFEAGVKAAFKLAMKQGGEIGFQQGKEQGFKKGYEEGANQLNRTIDIIKKNHARDLDKIFNLIRNTHNGLYNELLRLDKEKPLIENSVIINDRYFESYIKSLNRKKLYWFVRKLRDYVNKSNT